MSVLARLSASLSSFSTRATKIFTNSSSINVDIYAKVFISASLEKEALTELLCRFSDAAKKGKFFKINTNVLSIDLEDNDFYDPQKNVFINFRYYLDVTPHAGVDESHFYNALAKLVAFIKKQKLPVVTACDYEDRLAILVERELAA